MKKNLLFVAFSLLTINFGFSQTEKAWKSFKGGDVKVAKTAERESFPKDFTLMQLDLATVKQVLYTATDRFLENKKSAIISLPNSEGKLERFQVYEASNFDAALQAQFPEIRSYVGQGLDDKFAQLRLSLDPRGIQTMIFRAGKSNEFMEPYSQDGKTYAVYTSKSGRKGKLPFTCSTPEQQLVNDLSTGREFSRSSTGQLKTMRLAISCTAEYANYFGATSASQSGLVLAAFNATMTRVNGVFETDFAIHMNLIATNSNVIYYNPATDPYSSAATGQNDHATYNYNTNWNIELQNTLTSVIGVANYDIGHLFGASGGGGNAGCIGCVCNPVTTGSFVNQGTTYYYMDGKGMGYTSPADGIPSGDNFDIDYVTHEMGHQFGANHTFSNSNEGAGVNKEVGSGVTIMGYAGITNYDTHAHSIDVFHSASIAQVQANMVGKTCPSSLPITHSAPVVNAGADWTIPKSTPFMLTGSATDAGGVGNLTFTWEQNDDGGTNTGSNSSASATKTTGPNWVNYQDSASPVRYFPIMSSVLAGSTTTAGLEITAEALSSVNRTLNFRLTARDNVLGLGQTNFDDMAVTVDGTKGPLTVTSQNTSGISYPTSSTQNVSWSVNNTNAITGGANVDILITTDNGVTWTTLLSNTPNDGSETVIMPAIAAPFCRLMVKASGNIFFNVNSTNFAVGYTVSQICNTYTNNTIQPIPDGPDPNNPVAGPTLTSIINIPISQTITDVNVNVNVTHSWIRDLVSKVVHPDGTTVILGNRICNNQDGYNITFNDGAPTIICTAPITSGTFNPNQPLNAFNSKNTNGNWSLEINDFFQVDEGNLNSWSIEVCYMQVTLSSENFDLDNFTIFPNPSNGIFNIQPLNNQIINKIEVTDINGRIIKSIIGNQTQIDISECSKGVYFMNISSEEGSVTKKIIKE